MYKLKFKYYLLYLLFVVMLYCILIIFLPSVKVAEFDTSIPSARQIIVHNLKNYLMWSVSFITWPLNFLFESFVLSFNIKQPTFFKIIYFNHFIPSIIPATKINNAEQQYILLFDNT